MKKGFTLVELLAVIIILGTIVLISVPIVSSVIDNAERSAGISSAKLYVNAVEEFILNANLDEDELIKDGICTVQSNGTLLCGTKTVQIDTKNAKVTQGVIILENYNVVGASRLKIGNYYYGLNSNGDMVLTSEPPLAIPLSGSTLPDDYSGDLPESYGSKYLVYVNDTTSLYFRVIGENADGTTNLILERNICSNGSYATAQNLCKLAWITAADYTQAGGTSAPMMGNGAGVDKGPVTAMNYLNQATSSWTNITYDYPNYNDEGGKFTDFEITGHARLPYKSEIQQFAIDGSNRFLYDYLAQSSFMTAMSSYPIQTNAISGLSGYWLFSSDSSNAMSAYMPYVSIAPSNGGSMTGATNFSTTATSTTAYGVRPVITLEL